MLLANTTMNSIVLRSVKPKLGIAIITLFFLGTSHMSKIMAQSLIQRIEPSFNATYFGSALDFDDRTAIIGSQIRTQSELRPAMISIFEMVDGQWEENIHFPFPCGLGYCQPSVDLDGDLAVVSSTGLNGTIVLERGVAEWDIVGLLDPNPGQLSMAIAIDDRRILIGEAREAYIFENMNERWTKAATLSAPGVTGNSGFGQFVSIENNLALVSAYAYNGHGAVFVFQRDGDEQWNLKDTIEPSVPKNNQQFGRSFSLDENRLVVGAANSVDGGDVYVFEYDGITWKETANLHAFDGGNRGFGISVAIDGDRLVVNDGHNFGDTGFASTSVYNLVDGTWERALVIPGTQFGLETSFLMWDSVALHGDIALVGGYDDAGFILVPETISANSLMLCIVWLIRRRNSREAHVRGSNLQQLDSAFLRFRRKARW
jgi:hypothetical protein